MRGYPDSGQRTDPWTSYLLNSCAKNARSVKSASHFARQRGPRVLIGGEYRDLAYFVLFSCEIGQSLLPYAGAHGFRTGINKFHNNDQGLLLEGYNHS